MNQVVRVQYSAEWQWQRTTYVCKDCERKYRRYGMMKRHVKSIHNREPLTPRIEPRAVLVVRMEPAQ